MKYRQDLHKQRWEEAREEREKGISVARLQKRRVKGEWHGSMLQKHKQRDLLAENTY